MARQAVLQKAAAAYDGLLYAIVDAAADEHLHDAIAAEPPQSGITCLYDGMPAARYARYAPYLMRVHAGSPLFQRWPLEGWQAHWGIFLISRLPAPALKRHLKRFLQAKGEGGKRLWLRFYDPRVLPHLLMEFDPAHLGGWFRGNSITACLAPHPGGIWVGMAQRKFLDHVTGLARLDSRQWEAPSS
jgi:hypothetical protein